MTEDGTPQADDESGPTSVPEGDDESGATVAPEPESEALTEEDLDLITGGTQGGEGGRYAEREAGTFSERETGRFGPRQVTDP